VGREDRVALADLVLVGLVGRDLEAPAGRAGLADRAGQEDTNQAALGVMADTGPADREGLASLGPASPDPEDLEDMILGLRAGRERAARGRRDRDLADRAAPDLGRNPAHLRRNPAHLRRNLPDPDPTPARPHRMLAELDRPHPHRTQARPQEPTRLAAPTRPEEPTRLVAPTLPEEPTRLVAPTLPGTADSDADRPC
jgi:hypothetical protein